MNGTQTIMNKKRNPLILDEDQIAARRIPIEETEIDLNKYKSKWKCAYCSKLWSSETPFLNHMCKKREKAELIQSPIGIAAYSYYSYWMKIKKYSIPSIETFTESMYFTAFISFAEFIKKTGIQNPQIYIELAKQYNLNPTLWKNESLYKKYIDYLDEVRDPYLQVVDSLNLMLDTSERKDLDLISFLEKLSDNDLISLIRERKISAWLVFRSKLLKEKISKLSKEDIVIINDVFNLEHLSDKFDKNKDVLKKIDELVELAGI